ncbi:vegetative cell wall protein gp1-like [Ixodes scapularis]
MPPKKTERSLRSQSARPPTSRGGAPGDGSPVPAATPPGPPSRVSFSSIPAPPSNPVASRTPGNPTPATQELVSALTTALRAAFPEAPPPRRACVSETAQPVPLTTTDDDEEDLLFRGYPSSQDPAGRYRARIPDDPTTAAAAVGTPHRVETASTPGTSVPPVPQLAAAVSGSSPLMTPPPAGTSAMPSCTSTGPAGSHGSLEPVTSSSSKPWSSSSRPHSKGTPTRRPPTFWEPRSPHHSPPLLHPTGPPDRPTVAEEPPTVAAVDDRQQPAPEMFPTPSSELFPHCDGLLPIYQTLFSSASPCGTPLSTRPSPTPRHQQW